MSESMPTELPQVQAKEVIAQEMWDVKEGPINPEDGPIIPAPDLDTATRSPGWEREKVGGTPENMRSLGDAWNAQSKANSEKVDAAQAEQVRAREDALIEMASESPVSEMNPYHLTELKGALSARTSELYEKYGKGGMPDVKDDAGWAEFNRYNELKKMQVEVAEQLQAKSDAAKAGVSSEGAAAQAEGYETAKSDGGEGKSVFDAGEMAGIEAAEAAAIEDAGVEVPGTSEQAAGAVEADAPAPEADAALKKQETVHYQDR